MSYLALGGNSNSAPTVVTMTAATGIGFPAVSAANTIWLIAAMIVVAGTLFAFSRLGPRVALDAVKMPVSGKYRPWLTLNGRPVGRRFRR